LRKILGSPSTDGRDSPTGEGLIDRPHPRESVHTRGDCLENFAVDLVADTNLDGLEDIEDVEERERDV
jgi:hypothetical protein